MIVRESEREVLTVNNFEKLTKSPDTLGAFLRALPVLEGPWDTEFQRRYCDGCGKVSCDDGSGCPYEEKRNNPGWWLTLDTGDGGCVDRYAVIVTFHNGGTTGAVVEAETAGDAWGKVFSMFKPEIIASAAVSMILTPERGGAE